MHFFPGIYASKKTKKTTSFSNPLTGAIYSNRDFLKNCNSVPRSISNLDHIKQLKHSVNNQEYSMGQQNSKFKKGHLKKQQRKRIQRQIVAVHATARMAQPTTKTNKSLILNKKCMKAFDSDTLDQISQIHLSKTFTINQVTKGLRNKLFDGQRISKANQNINQPSVPNINSSANVFPDIQILLLDLLFEKNDFFTKIVRINLQKYFKSFFKKQLSGHFTIQFLDKVEYYLNELYLKNKLDDNIDQQQYPIELFTVSTRMVFLNRLTQMQSRKSQTNQQNINAMIKFYCTPSRQFRQSCLRDILLMLSLQVYEKFNCSRHEQYILLDQNGKQITEIVEIKFSTRKLFLTSKRNHQKNYNQYLQLIDQYYRQGKKLSFNQNIKLNFRNRLAQGSVDEGHFNYCENYDFEKVKRNFQLQNAEVILKRRMETHRVNKYAPKQETVYYQRTTSSFKKSNEGEQINQNNQVNIEMNSLSSRNQLQPSVFWKIENTRISPERSQSPTRAKSPSKGQSGSSLSRQRSKLKQFLKQNPSNTLKAQIQKKIRAQFKDLATKNDFIDFKFNYEHKQRVMNRVLKEYFLYFKDKEDYQIDKIIVAIKSATMSLVPKNKEIYLNNQVRIQNKSRQQLPLIQESKVSMSSSKQRSVKEEKNSQDRERQLQESLSWQQFKNLRIVIECMQPKQVVMAFISKYLNFNEFGQLSKLELFNQIAIILSEKTDNSTVEVIAEVIWSWFESNSIIQNGFIRRVTLESWYEKYKIVYCMLVSLIFGTNHKTALDLAYEILV